MVETEDIPQIPERDKRFGTNIFGDEYALCVETGTSLDLHFGWRANVIQGFHCPSQLL